MECSRTGDSSAEELDYKTHPFNFILTALTSAIVITGTEELYIHPSHNVPGDGTAKIRLDEASAEYKRRIAGVSG